MHTRTSWLAKREVTKQQELVLEQESVAQAMQLMSGVRCDIVIKVAEQSRVSQSEGAQTSFVGQNMEHQMLSSLMVADDQPRFAELLEAATCGRGLQSMPASLNLSFKLMPVQIYVAYTGIEFPRFLIGICEDVNNTSNDDCEELAGEACEMRHADNHVVKRVLQEENEKGVCFQDDNASLASRKTVGTSFTAEVFGKFAWPESNNMEYVKQCLEQIASTGSAEHWLLRLADVTVIPDKILGEGACGQIVAGRFRGSLVALKVTKSAASSLFDSASEGDNGAL